MYEDYLKERQKYRRRKVQNVQRVNTSAQRYRNQVRQFNKKTFSQLSGLEKTALIIGKSARLMLNLMKTEVGLILIGAAGIASLVSYLHGLGDRYSSEYAGEYGESGLSNGKLSQKGKDFLIKEEGLRTKAYQDTKGKWTIGVGHTGSVDGKKIGPGMEITEAKARQLLDQDVKRAEDYVNKQVKVPVTQNMFDAMVSYVFNVGSLGPKFLQKINSKDYKGAMEELTTIDAELQERRKRERALFGSDINADNTLKGKAINAEIVGKTSSAGKLTRAYNGDKVGNYKMANPVAHKGQYYIDLSDRVASYLKETSALGGSGLVTSGAEGKHAGGNGMTHEAGNKVDIVAYKNTNEEWAETAIPFLKNRNTAFVVFEGFTKTEFIAIRNIIYSKIDDNLKKLCEGRARQAGWGSLGGKYLDYADDAKSMRNGRHLDIGILTNAYSKNEFKETEKQNKVKEIPNPPKKEEKKQEGKPTGGAASITIPEEKTGTPTNMVNTGAINLKTSKQTPNKTKKS